MRKCLITGSEGFVGQYVTKKFLDEGYKVFGIDNLSKYGVSKVATHSNYQFLKHDLTLGNTTPLVNTIDPDVVIDLAEDVGGISYLNEKPNNKLISSLNIRYNFLSGLRKSCRYVCISSSCVYERVYTSPTPELDLLDLPTPFSPYALSKYNAEYISCFWAGNVSVARLFNVAGRGDDHPTKGHVIADLVRKFKNCGGKPVTLVGDGQQFRNFTHGEDIADALYLIAHDVPGHTYNVGHPNNTFRIWDLAVRIAEKVGINSGLGTSSNPIHNIRVSQPCIAKLQTLGYKPKWDMERILNEAVEYYV